jgi:hypothetical protein
MKAFDLAKAWEEVKHETLVNKPHVTPYAENVVKARELLLLAQTLLSTYETQPSFVKRIQLIHEFEETMQNYRREMYQTKN